MRARKVCAAPGCANLAKSGSNYCEQHYRPRKRAPDRDRPSAAQRGYDADWQDTRAAFLAAHPFCVVCGEKANEVDHIIPISEGGARLDWSNLRSMCKHHHSRRTALHTIARGRGKGSCHR